MSNTEKIPKKITANEMQKIVDSYIEKNGGYWEPFAMLAAVVEEVGELSREISHLERIKIKKNTEIQSEDQISNEMGDLLFAIICVANYYKIDIGAALLKSIAKYEQRDQNRFKK